MKFIATLAIILIPTVAQAQSLKPIIWGNIGYGSVLGIEGEDVSSSTSYGVGIELPLSPAVRLNVEGGLSSISAEVEPYTTTQYSVDGWFPFFPIPIISESSTYHPGFKESTQGGYLQGAFTLKTSGTAVFCLETNLGATIRFASMEKFQLAESTLTLTAGARVEPHTSPICIRGGWGLTQGMLGGYFSFGVKI